MRESEKCLEVVKIPLDLQAKPSEPMLLSCCQECSYADVVRDEAG